MRTRLDEEDFRADGGNRPQSHPQLSLIGWLIDSPGRRGSCGELHISYFSVTADAQQNRISRVEPSNVRTPDFGCPDFLSIYGFDYIGCDELPGRRTAGIHGGDNHTGASARCGGNIRRKWLHHDSDLSGRARVLLPQPLGRIQYKRGRHERRTALVLDGETCERSVGRKHEGPRRN